MPGQETLSDCVVTLGVTGGIAAYKTAELVRLMRKTGIQVQVVMTSNATRLMSAHTLATLSDNPVVTEMFAPDPGSSETTQTNSLPAGTETPGTGIPHIRLSRSADLLLIAPATANIIGKCANGIADDLLSTTILASSVPVLFAPAMNDQMWQHKAVQANIARLRDWGYHFAGPGSGALACGTSGTGRMSSPEEILDVAVPILLSKTGRQHYLITAGPTEEPIDPVRVLSNRSSGKMGVAIAEAARNRGHRVTLIAGPMTTPLPFGVNKVSVQTAEEMFSAVKAAEQEADVMIMTAAVADYRLANPESAKMPSGQTDLSLDLATNPDIVASIAPKRSIRNQITIGFALEIGEAGEERARKKLETKGLDLIVLNDATKSDSAFGGDTTHQVFIYKDRSIERRPVLSKAEAARELVLRCESLIETSSV